MAGSWKPKLETGIPAIDTLRRKYIEGIEPMGAALENGEGEAERALEWLSGFVLELFEAEERWMRDHRFPLLREHVAKHDQFISRIASMTKDFGEEGASAVLKLRLRNALAWLEDHIEDDDRDLGKHREAIAREAAARQASSAEAPGAGAGLGISGRLVLAQGGP